MMSVPKSMTYGAIGVASILSAGLVGCKDDDDVNCDGVDFIGRFDNSDCAECLESDTFGNCKGNIPTIAEACDGIAYEADYEIDINNKCGVCLSYQFVANPQMVQGEAWSACGGTAAPCDGLNFDDLTTITDGCKTCYDDSSTPMAGSPESVQKFVNTCGGSIDFGSDICEAQTYSEYSADGSNPSTKCKQCYDVFQDADAGFWGGSKIVAYYVDRCKGKTESADSCATATFADLESPVACLYCTTYRFETNTQSQETYSQAYLSCGGKGDIPCLNSPSYQDIEDNDLTNLPAGACKTCVEGASGTDADKYSTCGGAVPCESLSEIPTQAGQCFRCIQGLPDSVTDDGDKLAACGGSLD